MVAVARMPFELQAAPKIHTQSDVQLIFNHRNHCQNNKINNTQIIYKIAIVYCCFRSQVNNIVMYLGDLKRKTVRCLPSYQIAKSGKLRN